MIITERDIIGNRVGTWTELTEVLLRTKASLMCFNWRMIPCASPIR